MENYSEEQKRYRAKEQVKKLKEFYQHLTAYLIINIILIIIIGTSLEMGGESFWHFSTFTVAFFWGIGLLFHAFGVFGLPFVFGKDWEQRKIKEFMEKDRKEYHSKEY
jgi:hypothetical protein